MLRRVLAPLCCAAVLAAGLSGCSGSDQPKKASGSTTAAPSSSGGTSASGSGSVDPKLASVRERIQQAGSGTFTQSDEKVGSDDVSSARGDYSLTDHSLQAKVTIPDSASKKVASAQVRVLGDKAYLQVAQWKQPSRSCWLATTPSSLSQQYALDVSSGSDPLAVGLVDAFDVQSSSGPGTYQGHLPLSAVLPLLNGSLKQQLERAKPKGSTPAFLLDDGKTVSVTVPGYGLVPELAAALGVEATQLKSIENDRYTVTVTPGSAGTAVAAPAAAKQMTDKQLAANTCG